MTFSTCPNPSSDRKSTRRLFRSAPVSTRTSSSSTRAGLAGFHTRNFAVKVPMLRNDLFDLPESQLHRSGAPKDGDHHFQRLAVFVDLVHHAGKAGEGTFADAHRFVLLE